MELPNIFLILINLFPWGFLKLFIIVLLLLYIVFAAVIVRQVTLMGKVVEIRSSPILNILSFTHLIAAIVSFFLSLTLL